MIEQTTNQSCVILGKRLTLNLYLEVPQKLFVQNSYNYTKTGEMFILSSSGAKFAMVVSEPKGLFKRGFLV